MAERRPVPRDREDDYTREAADARRSFAEEQTGASLEHVSGYSFDPAETSGNIEHFTGVAQVPIGLAGPVKVDGEHAQGDFYVPMATAEGTLVASYNRGMRLLYETGGIKTTILDDRMQRAPAFLFPSAREMRDFRDWINENYDQIKEAAEATTSSGRLLDIELYPASRILYTRFNFTTGDAAGQNLTGKATQAACHWIVEHNRTIEQFFLESNFATDKKSSQVNMLRTRGKRVVAEALIPNELIEGVTRTSTDMMFKARQVSQLGGFMSGVTNNGAHSANGVTAIFIATGQDAANVAESSAAFVYVERRENGDYYYSITIPSLIVATYGGGTGLPTQRECLELLGCYGKGKVQKFAEIVAATVLCGEISLGAAVVAEEWVEAHDLLGRNRPG
jgi:hydroxymethylglutaryl-CoA reductase (NADPH)